MSSIFDAMTREKNKALFDECRSTQRNGKVERMFETFFGRIRAMLNGAGVKDQLRSGFWAESAMTVRYLLNVTSIKKEPLLIQVDGL
jgi:hypothetical protein